VRNSPDKWTRAGYYATFEFRDEAGVRAAYERDKTFFIHHAISNTALYLDTPAARTFRRMLGQESGPEWEDFRDDQMHRRWFDTRARSLWYQYPTAYPHPEDDINALKLAAVERERGETLSDFMYRRAKLLEAQNYARLRQINTWLTEAPKEPQRVYPLMVRMIESLHRDVHECMTMLAETQQTQAPEKGFKLFR
jgi:hypothetical protein